MSARRSGKREDPRQPDQRDYASFGERIASLEAQAQHFATKVDIESTKLWFVLSVVGGAMGLLSLLGTVLLIYFRSAE